MAEMCIVKNTSRQSLYLNLLNNTYKKIPAGGTAEIQAAHLESPEMNFYRSRGMIVLVRQTPEAKDKASQNE
jgi:hypothetical protein